jgi:hypothetical protein
MRELSSRPSGAGKTLTALRYSWSGPGQRPAAGAAGRSGDSGIVRTARRPRTWAGSGWAGTARPTARWYREDGVRDAREAGRPHPARPARRGPPGSPAKDRRLHEIEARSGIGSGPYLAEGSALPPEASRVYRNISVPSSLVKVLAWVNPAASATRLEAWLSSATCASRRVTPIEAA